MPYVDLCGGGGGEEKWGDMCDSSVESDEWLTDSEPGSEIEFQEAVNDSNSSEKSDSELSDDKMLPSLTSFEESKARKIEILREARDKLEAGPVERLLGDWEVSLKSPFIPTLYEILYDVLQLRPFVDSQCLNFYRDEYENMINPIFGHTIDDFICLLLNSGLRSLGSEVAESVTSNLRKALKLLIFLAFHVEPPKIQSLRHYDCLDQLLTLHADIPKQLELAQSWGGLLLACVGHEEHVSGIVKLGDRRRVEDVVNLVFWNIPNPGMFELSGSHLKFAKYAKILFYPYL